MFFFYVLVNDLGGGRFGETDGSSKMADQVISNTICFEISRRNSPSLFI